MSPLSPSFFERPALAVARDLLGCILFRIDNTECMAGVIVETEAYVGLTDRASHSFNGKRTARNEHMYSPAATAYVYICYGMHQMLNVVTNKKGIPDAVLIRALEPIEGIEIMLKRTGKAQLDNTLTKGPGNVGKAMGISKMHSGLLLLDDVIYIAEDGQGLLSGDEIGVSKRIGVEPAGADGLLPYRFYVKGNRFVSSRPWK